MLRINLLPPYIYQGAKRRNATVLWAVLVMAVAACFIFWKSTIDATTADLKKQADDLQPKATQAKQMQAKADSINSESQVIRDKRDFVANAAKYNRTTYQPVIENVRRYTMKDILYYSLQPSGQTVTMAAYAPSLAKLGHYMMWMEHNPEITGVNVQVSGLPSFPFVPGTSGTPASGARPPGVGGYDFTATLTLKNPIAGGPSYAGAGGGAAPAGGGGMMGGGITSGGGMMGGGITSGGGMMGMGGGGAAPSIGSISTPGAGGGRPGPQIGTMSSAAGGGGGGRAGSRE